MMYKLQAARLAIFTRVKKRTHTQTHKQTHRLGRISPLKISDPRLALLGN